jgi:hypothetical protein
VSEGPLGQVTLLLALSCFGAFLLLATLITLKAMTKATKSCLVMGTLGIFVLLIAVFGVLVALRAPN